MCAAWLKFVKIQIKMAEFNSTEQTQILEKPFDHTKKQKKLSKRLTKDAGKATSADRKAKNWRKSKNRSQANILHKESQVSQKTARVQSLQR